MATIKQIADLTNVSTATVSRVLNNDQTISVLGETRDRIIQVAKELGYKTIKERKTELKYEIGRFHPSVGILVCQSVEEEVSDPYFLSIRQGVEEEIVKQGIKLAGMFRLNEFDSIELIKNLDGLIVIGKINELGLKIVGKIENVVYINHTPNDSLYDSVVSNFEEATETAMEHLLELKYKRIGYIGGVEKDYSNQKSTIVDERFLTYERVMKKEGLFRSSDIYIGEYSMSQGYELMNKAIQQKDLPEAFLIASDPMAIGALRALQEANLKVPNDVAIVSFDDIELAKFASTPLTTMKIHTKLMGQTGVKLLLDRFNGRDTPLKITVPTKLVVRQSSVFWGKQKGMKIHGG